MKRGVLLLLVIVLSAVSYAQTCDYDPVCSPNTQSCGCGGLQTRYTLCSGGCSAWYPCSVSDKEALCQDASDNDCDSMIDCDDPDCAVNGFCIDADSDGYSADVDCDDASPAVHPGAVESCDNVDDDCDGRIDEELQQACGVSSIGVCRLGTEVCRRGVWSGCTAILPAVESCDGLDNNCDGVVDEGCACQSGDTQHCGTDTGVCSFGSQSCVSGSWSACSGGIGPNDELCGNSLDDDCDGVVDNGCAAPALPAANESPSAASPVAPEVPASPDVSSPVAKPVTPIIPVCIDSDGDGYGIACARGPDCDDNNAAANPSAAEVCDDVDNDCDQAVDDGLSRGCGESDVGICHKGTESCVHGSWSGCTAVLPKEELCGNSLDDNCDGRVDESCGRQSLSSDELALLQFLDLELGKGNYDAAHYLDSQRNTRNFMSVEKSSSVSAGKTRISIVIVPIQALYNVTIYEYIPKFIADSADKISFATMPEIVQRDPLVVWHFAEVTGKTDLSYEVVGEVEDAAAKTSTITFAESSGPLQRPWYFDWLPLVFIPIIGFVFIVLVELAHRRRGQ